MNKIFIEASDIIIFVFSIIGILTSVFEIISMIRSLLKRNNLNIGDRSNCHSAKNKKDVVIFSIIVVVFIPVAVLSFIKTFCVSYVPNVLGLTYPEACSTLAEHDLSFNKIVESNISDYIVVNQSICNDYVNKNTIIELEVKKSDLMDSLPDDVPAIDTVSIFLFENIADVIVTDKNYCGNFQNKIDLSSINLLPENIYLKSSTYNYSRNDFEYCADINDEKNCVTFYDVPVGEYDIIVDIDGYKKEIASFNLSRKDANLQENGEVYLYLNIHIDSLNQQPYLPYTFAIVDENLNYISDTNFYLNTLENFCTFSATTDNYGDLNVQVNAAPETNFWITSEDFTYMGSFELSEQSGLILLLCESDGTIRKIDSDADIFNRESEESGQIIFDDFVINYGSEYSGDIELFEIKLNIQFEINNVNFIFETITGAGHAFNTQSTDLLASKGIYQIDVFGQDGKYLFSRHIYVNQSEVFNISL